MRQNIKKILKEETTSRNYMVIQNLRQVIDQAKSILQLDREELDKIMEEHPWAVEHLTTAKDDIEEVYSFLVYGEYDVKMSELD